jgi:hypothetical protein
VPEHAACNLCGADDAKLLYRQRDERLRVDDIEWNLVQCRRCGLGYLDPRPTREEVAAYYPESYFADRAHMADRSSTWERRAATSSPSCATVAGT